RVDSYLFIREFVAVVVRLLFCIFVLLPPPTSTLFPYTTLFRSLLNSLRFGPLDDARNRYLFAGVVRGVADYGNCVGVPTLGGEVDRKSTRLNSSHGSISYAVFCLKKKNKYATIL